MKTIQISKKDFQILSELYNDYYKIYGDEETTVWSLDDLEEMRKIGQKFMDIFAVNFKK